MNVPDLSPRMEKVLSFVPQNEEVVADVGCDHAYVSIALVKRNIAKNVIAMDVRKGPLEIAKKNVDEYGLGSEVELRLSDGLTALSPREVNAIVIAGMGGLLVKKILTNGQNILKCECPPDLILGPQSDICEVRKYLHDINYHIVKEAMLIDEGKYYTVIHASYGGNEHYDNSEDYVYGRCNIEEGSDVFISFLKKESDTYKDVLKGLKASNSQNERTLKRIKELESLIDTNKRAYKRCLHEM
ncbi:MAG: SAM-dependent methyltransferase [Lachnospiraceae bacterium]|nr:SAM-dependent methyltransferase [Lachnospiraceae bacterium]